MSYYTTGDKLIIETAKMEITVPINRISHDWRTNHVERVQAITSSSRAALRGITALSDPEAMVEHIHKRSIAEPNLRFYIDKDIRINTFTVVAIGGVEDFTIIAGRPLSIHQPIFTAVETQSAQPSLKHQTDEAQKKMDKYREQVIAKLDKQINKGLDTYGQLLQDNNDLDYMQRLVYLQEELLDGAQYVEHVIAKTTEVNDKLSQAAYDIKFIANFLKNMLETGSVDHTKGSLEMQAYDGISEIYNLAEWIEKETSQNEEDEHGREESNK